MICSFLFLGLFLLFHAGITVNAVPIACSIRHIQGATITNKRHGPCVVHKGRVFPWNGAKRSIGVPYAQHQDKMQESSSGSVQQPPAGNNIVPFPLYASLPVDQTTPVNQNKDKQTNQDQLINFQVKCDHLPLELCHTKLPALLTSIQKQIEATITIKRKINIQISDLYDPGTRFTAFAAIPYIVHGRMSDTDEYVWYPMALAKQLLSQRDYQRVIRVQGYRESSIDVHVYVNAATPLWTRLDGRAIGKEDFDLELIVAHEIVHGLGFAAWIQKDRGRVCPIEYDLIGDREGTPNGEIQVMRHYPPTVFEANVVDELGNSVIDGANKIRRGGMNQKAKSTGKIYFETTQQKVELHSSKSLVALCHLSDRFLDTPDFLMTPRIPRGVSLEDKVRQVRGRGRTTGTNESILGPLTVDILQKMGWQAAGDAQGQQQSFQLGPELVCRIET